VITAASFVAAARRVGFGLASGVPCSELGPLVAGLAAAADCRWIGAANEGDAVAIATGAALGGTPALVLMQNSGLGNAINPLTSLNLVFRIPVLLVIAWRGEPGAPVDEPQHAVMGRITPGLLDLIGIPWERLPSDASALDAAFARAATSLTQGTCHAFVVGKGTCAPESDGGPGSSGAAAVRSTARGAVAAPIVRDALPWPAVRPTRRAAIAAVQHALRPSDVLLATTGYAGREMTALATRPNQLAMVGSMGCVSSLGLGLACVRRARRIVVLDGDGAALMRLGALATIGAEQPPNLVHVLLDNEAHDSTGGQPTVAARCDLGAVARAAGYPSVVRAGSPAALAEAVGAAGSTLTFVHVKVAPGGDVPPRPPIGPVAAAARLRSWLDEGAA
jgi:phosphonopyruvate decarboxylase